MAYGKGNLGGSFIKSIQSYEVLYNSITSGHDTINQIISEVKKENSMVLLNGWYSSFAGSPAESGATVKITTDTNVEIKAKSGSIGSNVWISFTVVEFLKLKSKQTFTVSMDGQTTVNQAISVVNIEKAFVNPQGYAMDGSASDSGRRIPLSKITSSTNVKCERNQSGITGDIVFSVLEVY